VFVEEEPVGLYGVEVTVNCDGWNMERLRG
jgi:hypothetical protein